MKYILLTLFIGLEASATPAAFNSLVCRAYDYYGLGGNRKVVEMVIQKSNDGYRATTAHTFEILQSDGSFQERDRTVNTDVAGLTCLQGGAGDDPRVVTCATPGVSQYINLNRIDRTNVMSAFSSRPGAVIKLATFESMTMGSGATGEQSYADKDCVLK